MADEYEKFLMEGCLSLLRFICREKIQVTFAVNGTKKALLEIYITRDIF